MPEDQDKWYEELADVARDVATSLIILFGALAVEWFKDKFGPEGPPRLTLLALGILELTMLVSFFSTFILALIRGFRLFNELVHLLLNAPPVKVMGRILRGATPTLRSLSEAFRLGLLSGFLVGLFLLASVITAKAPLVVLGTLAALLLSYVLFATYKSRQDLEAKGLGFLTACFVFFVMFFSLPIVTGFVIRSLGSANELLHAIRAFLSGTN